MSDQEWTHESRPYRVKATQWKVSECDTCPLYVMQWDDKFYVDLNNLYAPGEGERIRQIFDGDWVVEHPDGHAEIVHPIEMEQRFVSRGRR